MNEQVTLLYRGSQKECKDDFTSFVPIGFFNILFYLLKNGINANLYNLTKFNDEELHKFIKSKNVNIALISGYFGNHNECYKIARLLKQQNQETIVVLGGPLSVLGSNILKRHREIDFVIKKEGEISALNIVKALINKSYYFANISNLCYRNCELLIENPSEYSKNIDDFFFLPSQIYDYCHFVSQENFSVLITSRGCPFDCSFCSSPNLWQRKVRFYSTDLLISYLKDLRKTAGAMYFSIRDDNFICKKERVIEFCKKLENEQLFYLWNLQGSPQFIDDNVANVLSKAGCDQLQMGIETVCSFGLKLLNKSSDTNSAVKAIEALRKHLIIPFGYFIAGFNESENDVLETVNFIKNSKIMDGIASPLVYYPSTSLSKDVGIDRFFTENEILYYSKSSWQAHKNKYLKALDKARMYYFNNDEVFAKLNKQNWSNHIIKHFFHITNGEFDKAVSSINILGNDKLNPWKDYLLGQLYSNTENAQLAYKHYSKCGQILNNKNEEITTRLKALKSH